MLAKHFRLFLLASGRVKPKQLAGADGIAVSSAHLLNRTFDFPRGKAWVPSCKFVYVLSRRVVFAQLWSDDSVRES
jgi:hypothetical protein